MKRGKIGSVPGINVKTMKLSMARSMISRQCHQVQIECGKWGWGKSRSPIPPAQNLDKMTSLRNALGIHLQLIRRPLFHTEWYPLLPKSIRLRISDVISG